MSLHLTGQTGSHTHIQHKHQFWQLGLPGHLKSLTPGGCENASLPWAHCCPPAACITWVSLQGRLRGGGGKGARHRALEREVPEEWEGGAQRASVFVGSPWRRAEWGFRALCKLLIRCWATSVWDTDSREEKHPCRRGKGWSRGMENEGMKWEKQRGNWRV